LPIKKPVHQIIPLVSPPFDVLALGISYCPPLTDPFFIEKQLEINLQILRKRVKDFFRFPLVSIQVSFGEKPDQMEPYLIEAPGTVYVPPNIYHTLSLSETGENPTGIAILLKGSYEKWWVKVKERARTDFYSQPTDYERTLSFSLTI
jgi:hypothetical protein